jgi:carbamoyltransferase
LPPTRILGISAYYHDSAACLVEDGRVVAAAQEERFTRKKHDAEFPSHAVEYCLREAGITRAQVDFVGFYEKPLVKFERLLETYTASAPRGWRSYLMAMPLWLSEKLWIGDDIRDHLEGCDTEVLFGEHHESHAASAFYPSPFENAAVLTIDGVGEWATSSIGAGRGNALEIVHELRFPHSLGLLYSAFTYFAGFKVNSGEYKVMGLAPYGEPSFVKTIKDQLVEIREDGSLWMNQDYFTYPHGLTMTGSAMEAVLGGPARQPESKLTQREMDLARSIQDITEEVMLKMAQHAHKQTGMRDLCMAGGVALNCVGNGRILREGPFERVWVQPAAGDAGGALGVALSVWHKHLNKPRQSAEALGTWERAGNTSAAVHTAPKYADGMSGSFLGPRFSEHEISDCIATEKLVARRVEPNHIGDEVAALLASENVIGLLQGRMEFGPRALGGRSIIADARSTKMQSVLNLKIKFRESFRPFAPSVLREHVADWFELDEDSPYMLMVADVHSKRRLPEADGVQALWGIEKLNVPRSTVPSITHVDYSARIQTVRPETNGMYHAIIDAFYRRTGCPVIVNTSFNVRGEPIVCTPQDAVRCFRRTHMDALVLENFIIERSQQGPMEVDESWKSEFALD